jgi:L-cystine transport system permease protein
VVTLLSVIPLAGGIVLGTALALCRIYHIFGWQRFAQAYVTTLRSIPLLLQMFVAYFITKAVYEVMIKACGFRYNAGVRKNNCRLSNVWGNES